MRLRPWIAVLLVGLSLGLFFVVRANVGLAREVFGLANVIGANDDSQLSLGSVLETLGHVQMLLLGVAALTVAHVLEQTSRRRTPFATIASAVGPSALPVLVVVVLGALLVADRCVVVDGRRYFFFLDDAMCSMRYARNLFEGKGLVYNVGEHVEGYTNFLWVVVMAAVHGLGAGPALAPLWILVLSWAAVVLVVVLVVDLARAAGMATSWAVCAGLLVASDQNTLTWANSGLETSALTAAVTVCAWALLRRRPRTFSAALAAIPLLRADGFVLAAALGLVFAVQARDRRAVRALVPAAALALAHFSFRRVYYGHWLPNTYYLKVIDLRDRLRVGLGGYGVRLAVRYPFFLALSAVSIVRGARSPRARSYGGMGALGAVAFAQAGYAVYVGGDFLGHLRFVAPVLPILYASALFALREMVGRGPTAYAVIAQGLAVVLCPVLCPAGRFGEQREGSDFFVASLARARLLEQNVPAGALVSIYAAGTTPYHAPDLRFVDVYGKNDEHIAHMDGTWGVAIGHNKLDFDYIYARRRPDVATLLAPCAVVDGYLRSSAAERRAVRNQVAYLSQVAFFDMGTRAFERDYASNEAHVADPPSRMIDCSFVRSGAGIPLFWTEDGPPARASSVQIGVARERDTTAVVGFGPGWGAPRMDRGRTLRRMPSSASLDLWLSLDTPQRLEMCIRSPSADAGVRLTVNGEAVALDTAEDASGESCDGTVWRATLDVELLGRDRDATRLAVDSAGPDADLAWLRCSAQGQTHDSP